MLHILHESTADHTTIIGQTAWTHMGNITTQLDNRTRLYNWIQKVKFTLGGETRVTTSVLKHTEKVTIPTYFENRRWWRQTTHWKYKQAILFCPGYNKHNVCK